MLGAVDAHDGGVAAGALHGVAHDHVVVLLPDPAARAERRAAHQGLEGLEDGVGRRHPLGQDQLRRRDREPRALVERRRVGERRHGNVGLDAAVVA